MSDLHQSPAAWYQRLQQLAATDADAAALRAPGQADLSRGELIQLIEQTGMQFRALGLAPDSRIAVLLPQGAFAASGLLSVMANAVAVPLNEQSPPAELLTTLNAAGAEAAMVSDQLAPETLAALQASGLRMLLAVANQAKAAGQFEWVDAQPMAMETGSTHSPHAVEGSAASLILHTSGSTGMPKRVLLTHANLGASAANVGQHLQLKPSDCSLNVMPLFHSHGIVGVLLSSLVSGASVGFVEGFTPPRFFEAMEELKPTWYSAGPTLHAAILEEATDQGHSGATPRLRFVRSTSSALPAVVLTRLEALFGAPVIESFGMTEWSQMLSNPLPPLGRKLGSVGRATGVDVALLGEDGQIRSVVLAVASSVASSVGAELAGELLVRGPHIAPAYDGDAAASQAAWRDGWFCTGDLARVDADGYVFIVGRSKDIINRGGEKVAPSELEFELLAHPAVRDAAAFGVPHPTLGEDVLAMVVLRSGHAASDSALRADLLSRLAAHKVPSRVLVVEEIARSATGKLSRGDLAAAWLNQASHQASEDAKPLTSTEITLHDILCNLLARESLARDADFFSAGGDSLSAMRAMVRINKAFRIKLPPTTLFTHTTLRSLAVHVDALVAPPARSLEEQVAGLSDEEVMKLLASSEGATAATIAVS